MKAWSLFSGAGGFELGFDRAGIETVLQCENEPVAASVLARHWPGTERIDDVRDVGAGRSQSGCELRCVPHTEPKNALGLDLIYGGFPCQDVSVAGKRAGLRGERSGLWAEFARILGEVRPRWCVVENVPGLLSSHSGRDFGRILADLDALGVDVAWRTLDACHFGVPQRRRRVFLVGGLRDAGRGEPGPSAVLAVAEGGAGDSAAGEAAGADVAGILGRGSSGAGGTRTTDLDGHGAYIASPVTASAGHHGHSSPRGDGSDNLTVAQGVRRLTPRECERLMGWPDDHTRWNAAGDEIADSHRYRLCGNGVVAPIAEWIGYRLQRVEGLLA